MTVMSTIESENPARQPRRERPEDSPRSMIDLVWKLASSKGGAFGSALVLLVGAAWWLGTTVIVPTLQEKAVSDKAQAESSASLARTADAVARSAEANAALADAMKESLNLARQILNDVTRDRALNR